MNKYKLMTAIKNSISEVLETMFFMPVDFICSTEGLADICGQDETIGVQLDFKGPFSGFFRMFVPNALARQVSADFLGLDEANISIEDTLGTIKELINMLVGNTFSTYNAETVFNLNVPETLCGKDFECSESNGYEVINIEIDTLKSRMALELSLCR